MATDATGAPTTLGIPKFNTSADAPSGLGSNAQMDAIDVLLQARVVKPAGIVTGEAAVYNTGTGGWDRSSVTRLGISSIASGTPTGSKFVRDDGVLAVPAFAGSLVGIQVLTGSGTYTPTAGTTRVYIEMVGGGGGGGGSATGGGDTAAAGGGGGGAYAAKLLTSNFSGKTYVAGAGATAAGAGGAGNNGADSTFDATVVVAKAGLGGAAGIAATTVLGGAGGSAAGSTGDIKMDGSGGGNGLRILAGTGLGGSGGGSVLGPAQGSIADMTAVTTAVGKAGAQYGGGGGGSISVTTGGTVVGSTGGAGIIRIWEFA